MTENNVVGGDDGSDGSLYLETLVLCNTHECDHDLLLDIDPCLCLCYDHKNKSEDDNRVKKLIVIHSHTIEDEVKDYEKNVDDEEMMMEIHEVKVEVHEEEAVEEVAVH
jgi:hypothetical protein